MSDARRPTLARLPGLDAPLSAPPAIWTAFATQGRWKNWVLLSQSVVIAFLAIAVAFAAHLPPDVIVVSDDGAGQYVEAGAASQALADFLRAQRGKPSDLSVLAFTQRFVRLTTAINSTTIEEAWPEALGMMAVPLAEKSAGEAKAQRLVETYRLAQVRTSLVFDDVQLVERHQDKAHVRALVRRTREKLAGGAPPSVDRLQVDLVLVVVPRSRARPDGLEVLNWSASTSSPNSVGAPTSFDGGI